MIKLFSFFFRSASTIRRKGPQAIIVLIIAYLLSPISVHAQTYTYGWQIDNFDSQIKVRSDGRVEVTETLKVDFGTLDKHGIYRDIPYVYSNDDGSKTYTQITVASVKRNDKDEKYTTSQGNGYIRIKVGDANKTISSNQTYAVSYLATGVLKKVADYDELYWNVTGNYWDVPIQSAGATVTLPDNGIKQTACYQEQYGSTTECTAQGKGSTATFKSAGPLNPSGGMTIAVGYNRTMVPILIVARPKTLWEKIMEPQNLLLLPLTAVILWTIILWRWWKYGRDFWFRRKDLFDTNAVEETKPIGTHETVVVEYAPPENLRPAELGVIIDQKADTRDVTATIIDLATRGFLKIKEIPKAWLFGKVDYELTKASKNTAGLIAYEQKLYDELFQSGNTVTISSLKNTFYDELATVKDFLYNDVVEKKLFIKRPDKVRNIYFVVAFLVLVASVISSIFALANQVAPVVCVSIGVIVGILPLFVLANFMPRRTGLGNDLYKKTQGYYLFISKAEQNRQKFFENKNLFNVVLPYAITFGLVEKFASAMKEIGLKPQTTGWYVGAHPFNLGTFGNDVEAFSNSVSKSMASTPHSSGGSSGGGFSGGGFGGGGGGSW